MAGEEQINIKKEFIEENTEDTGEHKEKPEEKPEVKEVNYFQCALCQLREAYDYFGMNPPFTSKYILLEDSFVIEDPFLPPKTGQYIILGSICIKCMKSVCKDPECSVYFDGTYCANCAKDCINNFPKVLQDKINKTTK